MRPLRFLAILLWAAAWPVAAQVTFTSSNLPIVLLESNGQQIPDEPRIRVDMRVIDNGPGVRNAVTDPPTAYDGVIDIEIRGSSSQQYPKKQYRIETLNEDGSNRDVPLLGFPSDNDWILHAPYADKTLLRNVLAYDLSRRLGRYASRVRHVELVLNGAYQGVYVLMETIKRGGDRVAINRLRPDETSGDDLTGGYLLKIDKERTDPGWNSPFPRPTPATPPFRYLYDDPDGDEIAPEQAAYIQGFIGAFEAAVQAPDRESPTTGFPAYIDLGSFVDFFLLTELAKNIDGYRLSSYLHKDKDSIDGRLHAGPIWDFNQGFGNNDYYEGFLPTGLQVDFFNEPEPYPMPTWWPEIVETDTFQDALRARWLALRAGPFHVDSLMSRIDAQTTLLGEARIRNFQRWPILGTYVWPNGYVGQTYADEVGFLKTWLRQRVAWLDGQIATPSTSAPLPADAVYALSDPAPNPSPRRAQLSLTVAQPQRVRVEVFDAQGRRVAEVFDGVVRPGSPEAFAVETSALPGGLYVVRVLGTTFADARRLVVTR
jgi:hypothetical protein